jgi:hypothetical protein
MAGSIKHAERLNAGKIERREEETPCAKTYENNNRIGEGET